MIIKITPITYCQTLSDKIISFNSLECFKYYLFVNVKLYLSNKSYILGFSNQSIFIVVNL